MKRIKALAIETATRRGSIALWIGEKIAEATCIGEQSDHSQTLIPHIRRLLESHRLRPKDLDLIGVSKGPGSFTGIRVGIACAKGLAMGLNVPLVGVSTLEVLLRGFLSQFPSPAEREREGVRDFDRIALVLFAKKGEYFLQFWYHGKRRGNLEWIAQRAEVVGQDHLSEKLASKPPQCTIVVSPQLSELRASGHCEEAGGRRSNLVVLQYDTTDRFPDAADLAYLSVEKFLRQRKADTNIRPFYLRKTDAEILFKDKPFSVFKWERVTR